MVGAIFLIVSVLTATFGINCHNGGTDVGIAFSLKMFKIIKII